MADLIPVENPVFRIGGHQVSEVTRDTAQVGCTKVTRAEAKELLNEMDKHPLEKDFEIYSDDGLSRNFLTFTIRHKGTGWLGTSGEQENKTFLYSTRSADFCLSRGQAEKLLRFLQSQLSNCKTSLPAPTANCTTGPGIGASPSETKYIIEFQYKNEIWRRSANVNAKGEYNHHTAVAIAANEEQEMGSAYRYRAVPA